MCDESRMHGAKRGKIRSDCCSPMRIVKAADYLSLSRVGAEDSLESALKRADKALYEVKFTGKNNWKLKAE